MSKKLKKILMAGFLYLMYNLEGQPGYDGDQNVGSPNNQAVED